MQRSLCKIDEVIEKINNKRVLLLAGEEESLDKLPNGNWIAGTIPYFMDPESCCMDKERIHVTDITDAVADFRFSEYDENNINQIIEDEYDNGFTVIIIPPMQAVWETFSIDVPEYKGLFNNPLVGWVAGVQFENVGKITPKTYIGNKKSESVAVALHVKLDSTKIARVDMINPYKQGDGDIIKFPEKGFNSERCIVNGKEQSLYDYLNSINAKESLPLVANYSGANINISTIWDREAKRANMFAPAFPDVEYRIAKSKNTDYHAEFKKAISEVDTEKILMNYNCLMNYFNFELEGKKLENISGPITFGEIAYQLVNSTYIYLVVEDAMAE